MYTHIYTHVCTHMGVIKEIDSSRIRIEFLDRISFLAKSGIECLATMLNQLCMLSRFSHAQLFATPWTVAHQAPLSMGFSRQEYWSGSLLLRENTKWQMTPVLREGPEARGALEWEAAVASAEASVVASRAGVVAGARAGAEAAELTEAGPRTRSGSPLPSWAAWSRT